MQRAKEKILKEINKINDANYKLITRKFNEVFGLKNTKIKKVDTRISHTSHNIYLHVRTHNYTQCTRYVLDLINEFQSQYSFVKLSFINLVDYTVLELFLYWEDYVNELTESKPSLEELRKKPDYSGVQDLLKKINDANEEIIKRSLRKVLKRKQTSLTYISDEVDVILKKNTFNNIYSRQNFNEMCKTLRKEFPFIEIFHDEKNIVVLRVWWKLYLHTADDNVQLVGVDLGESDDENEKDDNPKGDNPKGKSKNNKLPSMYSIYSPLSNEMVPPYSSYPSSFNQQPQIGFNPNISPRSQYGNTPLPDYKNEDLDVYKNDKKMSPPPIYYPNNKIEMKEE